MPGFYVDPKKNPLERLTVTQVKPRVSDKNSQDSRQNPKRNQLPQIHRDDITTIFNICLMRPSIGI
ncbi:MAG: hypothetical protein WCH01_16425 [Methylococcaceae bacterium]